MERVEMSMTHLVSVCCILLCIALRSFGRVRNMPINTFNRNPSQCNPKNWKTHQKRVCCLAVEAFKMKRKNRHFNFSRTVLGHISHARYEWKEKEKIELTLDEMQSTKRNNVICYAPFPLSYSNEWINDSKNIERVKKQMKAQNSYVMHTFQFWTVRQTLLRANTWFPQMSWTNWNENWRPTTNLRVNWFNSSIDMMLARFQLRIIIVINSMIK